MADRCPWGCRASVLLCHDDNGDLVVLDALPDPDGPATLTGRTGLSWDGQTKRPHVVVEHTAPLFPDERRHYRLHAGGCTEYHHPG